VFVWLFAVLSASDYFRSSLTFVWACLQTGEGNVNLQLARCTVWGIDEVKWRGRD
jgi:hypothetical protein